MKKLIVACALVGAIVACKTENKSVSDESSPNTPKAECSAKSDCSAEKSGCCADKAKAGECTGATTTKPQN